MEFQYFPGLGQQGGPSRGGVWKAQNEWLSPPEKAVEWRDKAEEWDYAKIRELYS